ncbi:hypothetical protein [Streptomyces sp. 7-21]|uniref:hypothetical protein n=1 Tax=Streptomyces sp. 7-21 TaxID=2802283 RepID=UPI00191EF910|nr:hypothetical protein [Streptomyces sp. 7-21]MBL1067658.1 hypothetical protein [Streptomyces sp. 7-21]
MVIFALVLTPLMLYVNWAYLLGAAMLTGTGDEALTGALRRITPWVLSAGLGSLAVTIVLCALLADRDDGTRAARHWVAGIQLVLLLLPALLLANLPYPD